MDATTRLIDFASIQSPDPVYAGPVLNVKTFSYACFLAGRVPWVSGKRVPAEPGAALLIVAPLPTGARLGRW